MTEALVKQGETALATSTATGTFATLDGYKADDSRGKEGITSEDLRLPFVAIAQLTSKALDATEDAHIKGISFLDMYNSETKSIYGRGPVQFVPLRLRKRACLLTEDNKMGDQVDWNDPRVIPPWKPGSHVKTVEELEGMRILDWVVILLLADGPQMAVISFKGKSYPAGESLSTFVSMVKGPAFTARYSVSSAKDKNEKGSFGKFTIAPAGKPSVEEAQFAEQIYESIKDKVLVTADDEPSAEEAEPTGTVVDTPSVTTKDGKLAF